MRRAFTLIELLVVIAIVALLVSILLPTLGSARKAAREVKCLANIRSLQLAQLSYADAYRGYLVDVGLPHGGFGDEKLSWITRLADFYGPASTVRSPGDASVYWPAPEGPGQTINGRPRVASYAMNNYLSRTYGPGLSDREPFDRLEKIIAPAGTVQFMLLTETGDYAVSDHVHAENWGDEPSSAGRASEQAAIAKWGGAPRTIGAISNWSYLDGHAAAQRFDKVYRTRKKNALNPEVAFGG